eukprot:2422400-Amphidinium_carterae.2
MDVRLYVVSSVLSQIGPGSNWSIHAQKASKNTSQPMDVKSYFNLGLIAQTSALWVVTLRPWLESVLPTMSKTLSITQFKVQVSVDAMLVDSESVPAYITVPSQRRASHVEKASQ